jgi:Uma2 family endonuclease
MSGSDRVKPAAEGMKLTYDDFLRFPDDGQRHEIIDGEHYVTPSPNLRHQAIVGAFHLLIATWLETHPIGRVFLSPLDVILTEFDVVEPDLLYVSHARDDALTGTHVRGVPELVIEVASKGTRRRDETVKRRLYERVGVSEYWIADPAIDVVRLYQRGTDGHFARPGELSREAGDVLTTTLLPGLALPLVRIFRD